MDYSLLFSGVAAVTGIAALVVAIISRCDSKRANRLAGEANEVAGRAVDTADQANELARQSNQLAEGANQISRRALATSEDNLVYEWRVHIDDDTEEGVVLNDSAHDALDVTIVAVEQGRPVSRGNAERVAAHGQVVLDLSSTLDKHLKEVARHPSTRASSRGGIFISGSTGKTITTHVRFQISWKAVEQVPRDCIVKETLSHRDNFGTIQRR